MDKHEWLCQADTAAKPCKWYVISVNIACYRKRTVADELKV